MQNTRAFLTFILASISVILVWFSLTNLTDSGSKWFSESDHYRKQTEAFLNGHLRIHDSLTGGLWQNLDWVWSEDGLHQNFGLGVAIIRFPFEVAAKAAGFDGFPDRVVMLLFQIFSTFILALGFAAWIKPLFGREYLNIVIGIILALFINFNHVAVSLLRFHMGVYEEAVSYSVFFGGLLLGQTLLVIRNSGLLSFSLLFASCGFAAFVRPTAGFFAIASIITVFLIIPKRRYKIFFVASPVFIILSILYLYTNRLRFGQIFETGHHLSLTHTSVMYLLRFGSEFDNADFFSSITDTLGAIFGLLRLNFHDWYDSGIYLGQSPLIRFREFSFYLFSNADFIFFSASILFLLFVRSKVGRRVYPVKDAILIWSSVTFMIFLVFYSSYIGVASRYLAEFAPSVTGIYVAAFLSLFYALKSIWKRLLISLIYIIVWSLALCHQLKINPLQRVSSRRSAPAANIINTNRTAPAEYRCPGKASQLNEWVHSPDCQVAETSVLFLADAHCVELEFTSQGKTDDVEVHFFERKAYIKQSKIEGSSYQMTFCDPKKVSEGSAGSRFTMIAVKWISKEKAFRHKPEIRLERVSVTERN